VSSVTRHSILCVDDQRDLLEMLESFLSAFGFSVATAATAFETLTWLETRYFDAVVLDFRMPDVRGDELIREIRTRHPRLPVVLYTADVGELPRDAAGLVSKVIAKEGAPQNLVESLRRLLNPPAPEHSRWRAHARYRYSAPMLLTREQGRDLFIYGRSQTLSEGGLGGTLDAELEMDEVVRLEFVVPNSEKPMTTSARVRYRSGNSYGFEFLAIDSLQREYIRRSLQGRTA